MGKYRKYLIQINDKSYILGSSNSWSSIMSRAFRYYLRDSVNLRGNLQGKKIIKLEIRSKEIKND